MWDAPWHWVVLAIIVIALFGYKKLPDASRSLGRSLRIFKTEIKGMTEDDRERTDTATVTKPAVEAAPERPAIPPTAENTAPGAAPATAPATKSEPGSSE